MTLPTHIFREADIRGVERDHRRSRPGRGARLCVDDRQGCAAAYDPHAVARDCRFVEPRLYEALTRGLMAQGVTVLDAGIGPTPMLYFAVHHTDADGGIMITDGNAAGDENVSR